MAYTRTHTVLFDVDLVSGVQSAVDLLVEEWESRKPWIGEANKVAGDARLSALRGVLATCLEPSPEQ